MDVLRQARRPMTTRELVAECYDSHGGQISGHTSSVRKALTLAPNTRCFIDPVLREPAWEIIEGNGQ